MSRQSWTAYLDPEWDVLGPFPIHAREQQYLSPAFPLNLSEPIDYTRRWPSSYAGGGMVGWSKTLMSPQGTLEISFPEIHWIALRATEGWAALQHHATLRTTLTLYPPVNVSHTPRLLIDLKQGSYFTLRPQARDVSTFVPEWYAGNIYDMERALPHVVELPSTISHAEPTKFDLFVSGDYEIRLFGDPLALVGSSPVPVQKLDITVLIQSETLPFLHHPFQDVSCDFVSGYSFGDSIGISIQSLSGWWTAREARVRDKTKGVNLNLLHPTTIAPRQTRIISILIHQTEPFFKEFLLIDIVLEQTDKFELLPIILPIRHHPSLKSQEPRKGIKCTYRYANSMPTSFLAVPPKSDNVLPSPPLLALHGAGVDIFIQDFWMQALPDCQHGWTVIPTGRTSWGLDWHGPSAKDAWSTLDALTSILEKTSERYLLSSMKIPSNSRVIIVGHSNGGQGTWYLASRFPDRVLAAIPAAAYVKSQAYIPLTLSRGAHFIDPTLRSILESSLTPDDNDLHLSNLVDIPILAIHGGSDENVPVWHSREAVGILRSLYPSKDDVTFEEDPDKGHWYPDVLRNPITQCFLDKHLAYEAAKPPSADFFCLTVTAPQESGSLRGWKICQLKVPGRVGKLHVRRAAGNSFALQTSNVRIFCLPTQEGPLFLEVDDEKFYVSDVREPLHMQFEDAGMWRFMSSEGTPKLPPPPGRMQAILSSNGPITIVISTETKRELSVALRIAHILHIYHRLDSSIITDSAALEKTQSGSWTSGNIVFIGKPSSTFAKYVIGQQPVGPLTIVDSTVHILRRKFDKLGQAVVFTYPHPSLDDSIMLFLLFNDASGLERAVRLFPFRTGVAAPDWVVLDERADSFGAAGVVAAGVWATDWKINDAMTWL